MAVEDWSTTASSNATADPNINWAEGQLPSSVNNSARAEMAAMAAWLRAVGAYGTVGGSANAITLTTTQAPIALGPSLVGFIAASTNTSSVTLNRDGLGAKPFRPTVGVEFASGEVVQNRFYLAAYNPTSGGQWIAVIGGTLKSYVDTQDTAAIASAASAAAGLYVPLTRTVSAGTGLSGGGALSSNQTISLANTAVTPGSYTRATITVDQQGRITSASAGSSELPTQTGNSERLLTTDGSTASWSNSSSVRARGYVTVSGTTPTLQAGSVNVASVTRVAGPLYRVTFTNALATALYQVIPSTYSTTNTYPHVAGVATRSTSSFDLQFAIHGVATNGDPTSFDFVVYGGF